MNETYERFRYAIDNDLTVTAHVGLLNGDERVRLGPVANLTGTHVTIYDLTKGFRTTPLGLVRSVQVLEPEVSWFQRLFAGLRRLFFE